MSIKKYFWDLNPEALEKTEEILSNPEHQNYKHRMYTLLSRCDNPEEVFSEVDKEQFLDTWPEIRRYWKKFAQKNDFFYWWDTIYEEMLGNKPPIVSSKILRNIGNIIKKARIDRGWSQKDLAQKAALTQPDVSMIEQGKKNITIMILAKVAHVLDIDKVELDMELD